jgi:uncharacterized protein YacL
MNRARQRMLICSFFLFLMLLNSAITVATLVSWPKQLLARVVIVLTVVIVTVLPLLVWYRVTETHMSFIYRKLPELMETEAKTSSASSATAVQELTK